MTDANAPRDNRADDAPPVRAAPWPSAERAGWPDAALLALLAGLFLWGLGSYGLYEPHEGHFAGVSREMVTRGDWLTPHLNGAPYLNKPPLLYWLIATCYLLFGISEWSARLPLVLIGVGGAALAWHWARELWGLRAGRCAAAMLATATGWYLFSHQLLIDLLLSLLYLLALYLLWRAASRPESRWRWAAFHAVVGLTVLAKGLVGPLFAVAALALLALWRRDWRLVRQSRPVMGLLILLAICGPWLALLEYHNPGTLYYMVVNEHLKRVTGTRWPPDYTVVKVSMLVYLLMAVVWTMPWVLLAGQAVCFGRREARGQGAAQPVRDAVVLLASGALLPLVLFLPMPTRLIYYSLPAVAPFVLLAAGWWAGADGQESARGRLSAAACYCVVGAGVLSAGFWAPGLVSGLPQLTGAPELPRYIAALAFLLGAAFLAGGALLAWRRAGLALAALCVLLGLAQIHGVSGFAAYADVLSSKRLVEHLRDKAGADCVWISEGSRELGASAGIAYYLGQDAQGQARTVLVMEDDPRRPPPAFPGPKPEQLTTRAELSALWGRNSPVLFVTDVYRMDWGKDEPLLPDGERFNVPLPWPSQRRVYANKAAWERLR